MLSLPSDLIAEKNKLSATGAFLELLEIQPTGLSTIYIVNNDEDITWNSITWTRFRFEAGPFSESDEGETHTIEVNVSNVSRVMQQYVESTSNGFVGDTVVYRLVHEDHLDKSAALTTNFTILECTCTEIWASFTLGIQNFYLRRFPAHIYSRKICRYETFKGTACSYSGASTSCDRTFTTCISLSNSSRFGGQPSIPGGLFDV